MSMYAVLIVIAGIIAMDTTSGPQVLVSEPLASCTFLGILFGMPGIGLMMGILYQLLWLGYMPLGASRFIDGNMAAYIATAGLLTASRMFGLEDDTLNAAIVPAMLYSVVVGFIGLNLTTIVRRLNGRRNDILRLCIEKGETLPITTWHIFGIGFSFMRGVIMALVLIPAGALLCGSVYFFPQAVKDGLIVFFARIFATFPQRLCGRRLYP